LQHAAAVNAGTVGGQHGYTDWRLPNRNELTSIVELGCSWPTINTTVFPNTPSSNFWSSSPPADYSVDAWYVCFSYGNASNYGKSNSFAVRLVRGGQSFDNLGLAANPTAVQFVAETLADGSFQVGAANKGWTFRNGATPLTGLKAVPVAGKSDPGLGISVSEVWVGDVAANTLFTVSLPIHPSHDGAVLKSSFWKLVDGTGQPVTITNSKSGEFWLKLRTNHPPAFSPRQAQIMSAVVGATAELTLLGEDSDGDPLSYSVVSGGGAITGGVWGGSFADTGTNNLRQLVLAVSDGLESTEQTITAVVYDESGLGNVYADLTPISDTNSIYAAVHFLTGQGVIVGCGAQADGQRLFCPEAKVSQAEALGMLLLSARVRGLVELDEPYPFVNDKMLVFDAEANSYADYGWAATYAVTALRLGMIADLPNWEPAAPVTRLQLATWLNRLLDLQVPMALLKSQGLVDIYELADATAFANESDYTDARRAAFFGYLGKLGETFSPVAEMTRSAFAVVAARVLRTPTIDGLLLSASVDGPLAQTQPAITHGQALSITGVTGLAITEIRTQGAQVLADEIEPRPNYVRIGVALSDGQSLGPVRYIHDLETSPITLDTSTLDLHATTQLRLIVLMDSRAPEGTVMARSNVIHVASLPLVVNFPDADGDGVRDDLDTWPEDPLFAKDENNNGIPDNADSLWGLAKKQGKDPVTIDGQVMTLAEAVLGGKYEKVVNDLTPPEVTFVLPEAASTMTVAFTTFTATDAVGVTGYCISETESSAGCAWSATALTEHTFASSGDQTLYAWAKDAAGNVSLPVAATVSIALATTTTTTMAPATTTATTTTTAPTATATSTTTTTIYSGDTTPPEVTFALWEVANTLTVDFSLLSASDKIGIAGFCITETASSAGCTWSAIPPGSYTFASAGDKTLYAWAKDKAGNVSAPVSATVTITLATTTTTTATATTSTSTTTTTIYSGDTTPPEVTYFALLETSDTLTVLFSVLEASDEVGIAGFCITETESSAGCTWSATPPGSYTFASTGDKTLYAWAKDKAGNVSAPVSATVTITLATTTTTSPETTTTLSSTTDASTTTTTTTMATTSVTLNTGIGWNLLSSTIAFPPAVLLSDSQKYTSAWTWVDNGAGGKTWAVYLPDGQGGADYALSKGFVPLTIISSGEGFWLNSKTEQPLTISGTPVHGPLTYTPGWNLVGVKGTQPLAVEVLGPVTSAWKWTVVNGTKSWAVELPEQADHGASYAGSKGFGQLSVIVPGEGFWVNWGLAATTPGTGTWALWDTEQTTVQTSGSSEFFVFHKGEQDKAIVTLKNLWGEGYDYSCFFTSTDGVLFAPDPDYYGDNPPDMSFQVSENGDQAITGEIVWMPSPGGHKINVNFLYQVITVTGKLQQQ
jgi:hypothetical protein